MERGRFSAGTAQAGDPPVSLLLVIQDLHVSRELKLRLNSSPRVHPQCFPAVRVGDSDVLVSTGTSLTLRAAEPLKAKSPPVKPTSAQRHLVISAVPQSSHVTHKSSETAMGTSKKGSWRTSFWSACTKHHYTAW